MLHVSGFQNGQMFGVWVEMKKHWFLVYVKLAANYQVMNMSIPISSSHQAITAKAMNECREIAAKRHDIALDLTLVASVSYLGHMTKEEFEGEE